MKRAVGFLAFSLIFLGGALMWPSTPEVNAVPCERDECERGEYFWESDRCIPVKGFVYCDMIAPGECMTESCGIE